MTYPEYKATTMEVEKLPHLERSIVTTSDDSSKAPSLDYAGAKVNIDPAEKALVRKLDLWILPCIILMFMFHFFDRGMLSIAPLGGMKKDLHMSERDYDTAVSITFAGYLLGQIPGNMILTRWRPSLFLPACVCAWALTGTLACLVQSSKGLWINRFFLGLCEAPLVPGALYYMSLFYTRKELSLRLAICTAGGALATAFTGLLSIAIFKLGGRGGLESWRWGYLVFGLLTFVVGIGSIFVMPDAPLKARFLTPEDRQIAHDRVERDTTGLRAAESPIQGLLSALKDKKLYMLAVIFHLEKISAVNNSFVPQVIANFGFDRTTSLALNSPPAILNLIVMLCVCMSSGHRNERAWHIICTKFFSTTGYVIAAATTNTAARFVAIMCFIGTTGAVDSMVYSWVTASCGQTKEKKASAVAVVSATSNLALIWAPYLYTNPPKYTLAMSSNAVFAGLSIILVYCYKRYLKRENAKFRERDSSAVVVYAY